MTKKRTTVEKIIEIGSIFNDEYLKKSYEQLFQDENYYYLYKHIKIDLDMYVFGIFKNTQLKYNYPSNFNDPFDCLFDFEIDLTGLNRREFEKIVERKVHLVEWDLSREKIKKEFNNKNRIEESIKIFREKELTVTCFNSNPMSILMWSHYADNHKGMLLEFKIPKIEAELIAIPVVYDDYFPNLKLHWKRLENIENDPDFVAEIAKNSIFKKSNEWSYEKEFRVVGSSKLNKSDPLLQPFKPEYLSSVIMGAIMNDNSIVSALHNEISDFNKRHNLEIKIYKAELEKNKYSLHVPQHPRLAKV